MHADNDQDGKFDAVIDAALRARANTEPRTGLEDRILARLAAQPQRSLSWWRWPAIVAMVSTAVLVIAMIVSLLNSHQQQIVSRSHPTLPDASSAEVQEVAPTPRFSLGSPHHLGLAQTSGHSERVHLSRSAVSQQLPKLETFPAAQPQTAEEKLMARLVARGGSYDVAVSMQNTEPFKSLDVPELKLEPMEGTPADDIPRE